MNQYIFIFLLLLSTPFLLAQDCTGPGHSANENDSWLSCTKSQNPNSIRADSHWVLYDLGFTYSLHTSHFWNYSIAGETSNGMKNIVIDYSIDGINWTELGVMNLQEATGHSDYEGEAGLDFGGLKCRYILITSQDTWGGDCTGLSEVRFDISQTTVSIKDVYVDDVSIELYPNPTTGLFTIEGNLSQYSIRIVDAEGNTLRSLSGQSSPLTIDISTLPVGLYFISVTHLQNHNLCLKKILKSG